MKICHEVHQLDFGGVERVVRNLIKYDKQNQHTIVAYKDGDFRKELEKVGATIVVLEDDQNEADLEADIIHVHSGGSPSRMAQELGASFPVIETVHSPIRSTTPNEFVRRRVGVSHAVTSLNHNCTTILNGLDFEDYNADKSVEQVKAELGIPLHLPVIGRLGRLGRDKGLEEWLLTCYELQRKGLDFVPVIVGGPARDAENYLGKLKLMAESLPLRGVKWVGQRADTANYLQIMNVFLYPSPTEGFGLVFAEAMLAGAVVVAYETPVTRELFGGHAVLTKKGIPDLVQGVEKALTTEMSDALIPLGMQLVEAEYNAETMSKQYQELYEQCV